MAGRELVSDHALLRFLERVQGYDIDGVVEAMRRIGREPIYDGDVLAFMRDYVGVDLDATRRAILTPAVKTAIGRGAARVRIGPVEICIRGGVVATVAVQRKRRLKRGTSIREREGAWATS